MKPLPGLKSGVSAFGALFKTNRAKVPSMRSDKINRSSGQPFIPGLKSLGFSGSFDKEFFTGLGRERAITSI
jgi:hypothetical protein